MDLLYEEQPIVMFDTHPEPAAGLLWNALDRFKKHMTTAWTGVPYWQVSKGQLRLLWLTVRTTFLAAFAPVNVLPRPTAKKENATMN